MHNKDISPVGWYVGSYLLRFVEVEQEGNFDLEQRFLSWENTVLVKAGSIEEARSKVEQIARAETEPYQGGNGMLVQWLYEGITELLPVYEELKDGAEIMWLPRGRTKLKNLRKLIKKKKDSAHDK